MRTQIKVREQLISQLVLNSDNRPENIGLLYGQMGFSIVIARYAREYNAIQLETASDFLFRNVANRVANLRDVSFGYGLSGICWGIEYLVQNGIMPGPANELIGDYDTRIMAYDVRRMSDFSLETGLSGLWMYVWARIQGNMLSTLQLPFDEIYLKDWTDVLAKNTDKFPPDSLANLRYALRGKLNVAPLSLHGFVSDVKHREQLKTDLSLRSGLAGYITKKYLYEND